MAQLIVSDGALTSNPSTVLISTKNSAPVANAGPDQTAHLTDTVQLDGAGSIYVDGDRLTFRWSFTGRPNDSTAVLCDPSSLKPTFVVDKPGTYVVQLIVNDGSLDSTPSSLSIVTENSRPVANPGPGQTVSLQNTVTLDGAGSSDVDGDPLSFQWSLTSTPAGSSAALSDPTAVKPTFKVDLPGTYVAQLIVSDGKLMSTPSTVSILTVNSKPVANAGASQTVFVGSIVTLDASKSSDVDGDSLTYQWSLTSAPPGSTSLLSGQNTLRPTLNPDLPGIYVAQLIVSDGTLASDPATVSISTMNSAPVANAGCDLTGYVGDLVRLDGGKSSDVDGDPLTFRWSMTSRPDKSEAALSDTSSLRPSFVIDKPGAYVVQLIVNDGTMDSSPDTMSLVTQNSRPVAQPGPDQTAHVTDTLTLDGSKSYDVDGDMLSFKWSFLIKPAGSMTNLSDPSAIRPTFTVDLPGAYILQLITSDGKLSSDPATMSVVTQNSKPVANAGPDQTVYVGSTVALDGSLAHDVDLDQMSYQWSLTAKPEGSMAAIFDPTSPSPTFHVDLPGAYLAQLIVNDGNLSSDPDTVVVSTENSRPVARAGADRTVHVGDTVSLDGSQSFDADFDPLTYQWSFSSVPSGSTVALIDPTAPNPTFTVDLPGTYLIQLITSDGKLSSVPDTLVVVTGNGKPTANAGASQTITVGDTVYLDGSKSSDPDGDPLTYSWSLISRPSSSRALLSSSTTASASFVADVSGYYLLSLTVSDGRLVSDPSLVTITCNQALVTVPDVTSMTKTAARSAIEAAGLFVGSVTTRISQSVAADHVIAQSPTGGTRIAKGSMVNLTAHIGKRMNAPKRGCEQKIVMA